MEGEHVTELRIRRERLRELMADCPACVADDADEVSDVDLDAWLISHGTDPQTLGALPSNKYKAALSICKPREV